MCRDTVVEQAVASLNTLGALVGGAREELGEVSQAREEQRHRRRGHRPGHTTWAARRHEIARAVAGVMAGHLVPGAPLLIPA